MGEPTLETFLRPAIYVFSLVLLGIAIRVITNRIKILARPAKIGFRFLNVFVLWVVLPIVIFISIARYNLTQILGFGNALVLAFIGMGVCFVSAVALSHLVKDDRKTTIAITMNSAFMNVTYLGFPIVFALVGGGGLGPAALFAMGIGIPHLIFGVMLASSAAKKRVTLGFVVENVVTFPAAFALIVALLFVGFGAAIPDVARNTFDIHLAQPFFALMLLLVGYQMPLVSPRKYAGALATVGALRFLVCPLVTYLTILVLGLSVGTDITPKPAMIQAIMPPAVFNMILAYNYKLDLKLYGALVFYPTLVSLFIALPVLYFLIF
ncbi:MAG: AEC family transporter [Hadesarchaea archaeon]|nr:AEC family transporter [Hadesarchaea archaeon]